MTMSTWKSATAFIIFSMLACAGSGADKGSVLIRWGGSNNSNMAGNAKNLPVDGFTNQPLWEIRTGTHQYSIPTIDRGRIYIGCNDNTVERPGVESTGGGLLMCVEQATGKLVWQLPSPRYFEGIKPPYHFDQWRCGICSSPLVDGDRIYIIGNRGEILCLDRYGQANGNDGPFMDELNYMGITNAADRILQPADGDIIWKYNLIQELDVVLHDVFGSTLLMIDDLIFACTSNGIDDRHNKVPKPDAPTLIVLDKKTGRLVAKDDEKIGRRLFHCNWSSPIAGMVNGKALVFFGAGDGIMYAFEPPRPGGNVQLLKKVWEYDCNPSDYRVHDGTPIVYSSHSRRTPAGPSEIIGVPVFYKGRVYITIGQSPVHGVGQGCLSCIDAATGKKVWDSRLVDRSLAMSAIAEDLLYIPDTTGNLHCFDTETGERYWVHSLEGKTWCASAFVADGKVYVATESNIFWVFKAGKEKHIISQTRLKTPPITVTAVDGVLYIPTQLRLTAVAGTGK